jgi:hypothetical protein
VISSFRNGTLAYYEDITTKDPDTTIDSAISGKASRSKEGLANGNRSFCCWRLFDRKLFFLGCVKLTADSRCAQSSV